MKSSYLISLAIIVDAFIRFASINIAFVEYVIINEEDLDVSPDYFSYFSQTMHLLDDDNSLYCISAWNDQVSHMYLASQVQRGSLVFFNLLFILCAMISCTIATSICLILFKFLFLWQLYYYHIKSLLTFLSLYSNISRILTLNMTAGVSAHEC